MTAAAAAESMAGVAAASGPGRAGVRLRLELDRRHRRRLIDSSHPISSFRVVRPGPLKKRPLPSAQS